MIGTPEELSRYLWQLDKEKEYQIKEYRKKRSLDSNAYAWVLMQKIAEVVGITKEEVYRKNIKDVGKYEVIPLKDEAVDTFITAWNNKGIGWLCEILGESKFRGYTNVIAYYGTSIYNTKEMTRFINAIVDECKQLGIETMSEAELNSLIMLEER